MRTLRFSVSAKSDKVNIRANPTTDALVVGKITTVPSSFSLIVDNEDKPLLIHSGDYYWYQRVLDNGVIHYFAKARTLFNDVSDFVNVIKEPILTKPVLCMDFPPLELMITKEERSKIAELIAHYALHPNNDEKTQEVLDWLRRCIESAEVC